MNNNLTCDTRCDEIEVLFVEDIIKNKCHLCGAELIKTNYTICIPCHATISSKYINICY